MEENEQLDMMNLLLNEKRVPEITRENRPKMFSRKEANKARRFHMSFDNYEATPLYSLDHLAKTLGVKKIFIKDESSRFDLNAFKVLGGTYAITRLICEKMGKDVSEVNFKYIREHAAEEVGNAPFVTATDGNHGRGIAWAVHELGQKAIVYLPMNSAKRRVEAIRETGAEAIVTDLNYDGTVLLAIEKAKEVGGYMVQDTAWEGYTEVPTWIMQGYTTMGMEVIDQLALQGYDAPTHVFLQAGVGGMAAAILGLFVNIYKNKYPKAIIVEPNAANCIYNSAEVNDGEAHPIDGDLQTIMVGLACGVPSPIAWPIIRDFSTMFVSCNDAVAARGVRILANPARRDPKVVSGESGAAGIGAFSLLMGDEFKEVKEALGLNEDSVVLFFNTEGDTDPVNYGEIIWNGKYRIPNQ
ncbi:diaminopropionate ammonia-lyase [endosymbiont 'TC1' of Trimyema compressum]|uniref:diaminopropionate ammonia-lyase n=1 Tax=endosymbiont 'TC1' of Trimyema compressum TaxID=243899 RepID=UPI000A8AC777|nr:diaminopropionate ammonia-lyase [endosymbiont 'TC1' of Trimyema compressum]